MKQIKNYTTKDWCISFGILFIFCMLMQSVFRDFFIEEKYISGIRTLIGAAGWCIIYLNYQKKIERRNE